MATEGTEQVKKTISGIYERRIVVGYALSLQYAAYAIAWFRQQQQGNRFWKNRTYQAMDRMFTSGLKGNGYFGWRMAHGVSYGVYLELANDGRNQAIRPTMQKYIGRFLRDVEKLYAD